jgi:glycosyltransferase involved in cell wall biosynthesis
MKRVLLDKNIAGLEQKMALVTPWAEPAPSTRIPIAENPFRLRHNLVGKFVVIYAGNLGLGHDTQTLLGAMERFREDDAIRFVFVGGGRRMKDIQDVVDAKGLTNVLMLDYLPREELAGMLSAADVHLISQAPDTSGLIVPSKLYGILAAGRPCIYVGPSDTEAAYTITEEDVGIVVAPGDVEGYVAALQTYRQLPTGTLAERTIAALARGHTRESCTQALTSLVEELAGPATPHAERQDPGR